MESMVLIIIIGVTVAVICFFAIGACIIWYCKQQMDYKMKKEVTKANHKYSRGPVAVVSTNPSGYYGEERGSVYPPQEPGIG